MNEDKKDSPLVERIKFLKDGLIRDGCGINTAIARVVYIVEEYEAENAKKD